MKNVLEVKPIYLYLRDVNSDWFSEHILSLFEVGVIYRLVPHCLVYVYSHNGQYNGYNLDEYVPVDVMFLGLENFGDSSRFAKFLYDSKIIFLPKGELRRCDIYDVVACFPKLEAIQE